MHQPVLCFGVGEPSSRFTSKLVAAAGSGLPYLQNWVALEAGWFVTDVLMLSQGGCEKACHHPALGQVPPSTVGSQCTSVTLTCSLTPLSMTNQPPMHDSVLAQRGRKLGESRVAQSGGWREPRTSPGSYLCPSLDSELFTELQEELLVECRMCQSPGLP